MNMRKLMIHLLALALLLPIQPMAPSLAMPVDETPPVLAGPSVWRSTPAAAAVTITSDEDSLSYIQVTDSAEAPSTSNLADWTTGPALVAGIPMTLEPEGLDSGERHVHLLARDAAGNLSSVLTASMLWDCFYKEDFEARSLDAYIASGSLFPLFQVHNGTGDANQKVVPSVDDPEGRMLSLSSRSGWASDQVVLLDEALLAASGHYVFEGDVYPLAADGWQLRFSFTNGAYEGSNEAGVFFIDGTITTATRSGALQLKDAYAAGQWHHVRVAANPSAGTYAVEVDGTLLRDDLPLPAGIDRLAITAGHGKTAYYDNLAFYAAPLPAAENVSVTGAAIVGETLQGSYDFSGVEEGGTTFRWLASQGADEEIFSTMNIAGVYNNPTQPTAFTLAEPTVVSKIANYHWNNGSGQVPGQIALQEADGTLYGPWDAAGVYGNLYWEVYPYIALPAGTYTILDSGNGTWAHNDTSGNRGMATIYTTLYDGGGTALPGADSPEYTLLPDNLGSFLRFEVVPKEASGVSGAAVLSEAIGPVALASQGSNRWTDGIFAAGTYPFGGGDGSSEEAAYEIATARQLAQLAYDVNNGNAYTGKHFKLTADIDLAGKEWTPIGSRFYPGFELGFNGSFDGNGKSVFNMAIGSEASPAPGGNQTQAGLFGALKYQAAIKDLHVSGEIHTDGIEAIGMLAGYSESQGALSGCSASGAIFSDGASGMMLGGLAGYTSGTTITSCSSDVDITAGSGLAIGGLVGSHGAFSYDRIRPLDQAVYTGTLTAGNVPSYGGIGGIVGKSYGYTVISNAVLHGDVYGAGGNTGGIAGIQHNEGIVNCYASGNVLSSGTSSSDTLGGIAGFIDFGRVYNCYVSGSVRTSGVALTGALVGKGGLGSVVSAGYFDGTVNPELAHVRSTSGSKSYLHEFETAVMQGAAPGSPFDYAEGFLASGEDAILSALNGWTGLNQDNYPSSELLSWRILDGFNDSYPYLAGLESPGFESDASLASLALSDIDLQPAFHKDTLSYTATVPYSTGTVDIEATPSNPYAAVRINGAAGRTTSAALSVGDNSFLIDVQAEDGTAASTYAINITRSRRSSSSLPAINITTDKKEGGTTHSTLLPSTTVSGTVRTEADARLMAALLARIAAEGGDDASSLVQMSVEAPAAADALVFRMSRSSLASMAEKTDSRLAIVSPLIEIVFDGKALEAMASAGSGGMVEVGAARLAEGRPAYRLTATCDGSALTGLGDGRATVSIPYALLPDEDPDAVVVRLQGDDGSLATVRGRYDAVTGKVIFNTGRFATFVIGYNQVDFVDIGAESWYKDAVDFIAARDITEGTGSGRFSPEAELTRAQFVVLLMKAYGLEGALPENEHTALNFEDAGSTWYTEALASARSLGIVQGVGGNLFAPDRAISRQEMCVMLYNALEVIGELPPAGSDSQWTGFDDAAQVARWAQEAVALLVEADVVHGWNNRLAPQETTTRAEIAQLIYNLLNN